MRMDSEMIGILLSDSMHYTIVVSLEMSDEPKKYNWEISDNIAYFSWKYDVFCHFCVLSRLSERYDDEAKESLYKSRGWKIFQKN